MTCGRTLTLADDYPVSEGLGSAFQVLEPVDTKAAAPPTTRHTFTSSKFATADGQEKGNEQRMVQTVELGPKRRQRKGRSRRRSGAELRSLPSRSASPLDFQPPRFHKGQRLLVPVSPAHARYSPAQMKAQ